MWLKIPGMRNPSRPRRCNPLIAEPVHVNRIEVVLTGDEYDPGVRH